MPRTVNSVNKLAISLIQIGLPVYDAIPVHTNAHAIYIPSSLIGWWSGERNADDIAGVNHGVLEDDARFGPGVIGSSFSFDGDGDYVTLPKQLAISDAITVSAWVKFSEDDFDESQSVFSDGSVTLIKNGVSEDHQLEFDLRLSKW